MPNPMINPGVLNRVRGSVKFVDYPQLNVSASYLAQEGIELLFQGNFVDSLPVMAGVVQSPQPYILLGVRIHLVRSQELASIYKKQSELNCLLGDIRLYTDSTKYGDFDLINTALNNVADMTFNGTDPGVVITLTGTYFVNSSMWDAI
ncbi:hypothetical protein QE197_10905 [Arsenophonus nasoniae]|uniref:Uncharacterized protein n=2 Tax=Arsenophonus nasoniae TaxID=638 RepID=A0A4P7L1R8_9GAMM|nr:hypothetical protein [Arsenophonus nasoniae]QBY43974.1 hypothetical protein ArsFIN_25470 [Arsenophonus nasoniae]WGM04292.1 hypothetical protein QE258_11635 [Arsenophonus nasoniae]WGM09394.1 hypothetical protein QE197_10905 [Arsenophonus nasoniae]WGM14119.1 hypothetical protein QE193_10800 [Arsenophonus nasoniae]